MSSSFRNALSRQEETPKRNYSAYTQQQRKPGASLVSIRSPVSSRTVSVMPGKPRTPSYLRQFSLFRSYLNKRDQSDGWIDEEDSFEKPRQGQRMNREPPDAPKKFGGLVGSPRRSSLNVARRLFPQADEQKQSSVFSSSANVLASKIAYLRESLKLKNVENEQLKRELARNKKAQSSSLDVDRLKMECVQLRQENERLKDERIKDGRSSSNSSGLVAELDRREQYISSLDQQFKTVLGTLKAKHSAELTSKTQSINGLEQRVKSLEAEKIRLEVSVDGMIDRHSKEADQLLGKMRNLMEERNRLIIANADQGRLIERLRDEQENCRLSQTNQRNNEQEKPFKVGQLRNNGSTAYHSSYDPRY